MQGYSDDEIRNAAEIREWLTKLIADKQDEIDRLKTTLLLIDSLLKQGSFKTAANLGLPNRASSHNNQIRDIHTEKTEDFSKIQKKQTQEYRNETLETRYIKRNKDNTTIAKVQISNENIDIFPEEHIELNIGTPPFRSFFINRILQGMKTKDIEKVKIGQLEESNIILFEIETDKDNEIINKIHIKNYKDKERINEIFNTAAWVFTRMLEKSGK